MKRMVWDDDANEFVEEPDYEEVPLADWEKELLEPPVEITMKDDAGNIIAKGDGATIKAAFDKINALLAAAEATERKQIAQTVANLLYELMLKKIEGSKWRGQKRQWHLDYLKHLREGPGIYRRDAQDIR